MGDKDRDIQTPLTEAGDELMAGLAFTAKKNRTSILQQFVEEVFEEALVELPESDLVELRRRMRKLFVNSFKTPEMDKLVRDLVAGTAKNAATDMVGRMKPKIEAAIADEIEKSWHTIVVNAARALLADVLVQAGKVFDIKLQRLADDVVTSAAQSVPKPGGP